MDVGVTDGPPTIRALLSNFRTGEMLCKLVEATSPVNAEEPKPGYLPPKTEAICRQNIRKVHKQNDSNFFLS